MLKGDLRGSLDVLLLWDFRHGYVNGKTNGLELHEKMNERSRGEIGHLEIDEEWKRPRKRLFGGEVEVKESKGAGAG